MMPSRNINSNAFHTYVDHLKEAPNIVRKYCIAKTRGLLAFSKHQKIWEKNMVKVGSTATPMFINHPYNDIKKVEKGKGERKASDTFMKILKAKEEDIKYQTK